MTRAEMAMVDAEIALGMWEQCGRAPLAHLSAPMRAAVEKALDYYGMTEQEALEGVLTPDVEEAASQPPPDADLSGSSPPGADPSA